MTNNLLGEHFKKNLIYAIIAQGCNFCFNFLMSLLVPKMLGVEQFSYWQLFVFYSGYVGLFHFGLSDGIYLKYGGETIDEIDPSVIGSQLKLMILWQILISMAILPFVFLFVRDQYRIVVWIFVGIYLVVANATWFLGYVFQAVNLTSIYSTATIISKLPFIFFILIMFFVKPNNFIPFVVFYVIAQSIALIYELQHGCMLVSSVMLPLNEAFREAVYNSKIGINLTISNIISSLILGVGRLMVDVSEGITAFGMLSLSISLTNFFLQFIGQVSMVMFPALRKIEFQEMKKLFVNLRGGISYLLCLVLLGYVPLKTLLIWWLPQYTDSLYYLMFLLPICIFDGKMQLLYNTYMKVLRKEKNLLLINIISLVISVCACFIATFLLKDIVAVAVAMLLAIVLRSCMANVFLSKQIGVPVEDNIYYEVGLSILFVLCNAYLSSTIAFIIYAIAFAGYLAVKRKEIKKYLFKLKIFK